MKLIYMRSTMLFKEYRGKNLVTILPKIWTNLVFWNASFIMEGFLDRERVWGQKRGGGEQSTKNCFCLTLMGACYLACTVSPSVNYICARL